MLDTNTNPELIPIQPEIDIISVKMLNILGYDTTPLTFKVRRRLFGCCNEVTNTSVSESLAEIEKEDVHRSAEAWNFDFTTESPLPAGRYAWEKVRNCNVPAWYTSEDSSDPSWCVARLPNQVESVRHRHLDRLSHQAGCNECNQTCKNDQENKSTLKPRLVQTSIKGYAKIQKKITTKRLGLKRNRVRCLKGPRADSHILNNQAESTSS